MKKAFDVIVIGAGHAGIEAAFAAARMGRSALLVTLSLNAIGFLACNPNIGGTAKGSLVKEIDALGGVQGEIADRATIQTRLLNRANGPAVHSLRAQVDKAKYHRLMKLRLEREPNITLLESEVKELLYENGRIKGIKTALGDNYYAAAAVLTTGVYLEAKIIIGEYSGPSGPQGFLRSEGLTDSLRKAGIPIRRFKTGTPPRVLANSLDFSKMEPQYGEQGIPKFSSLTDYEVDNFSKCYLTYTNSRTHEIILKNLSRAPLYNGSIAGTGPRYCPSVEDKIVRFKDKERHQIFVEPEGADTDEMYVQGLSTSMPFDVQEEMVHSVAGLENAVIVRYGYAIEYDCIDPQALLPTLAVKGVQGLFAAGQINGTSGYEEAAAQGLMAGANACLYLDGKPGFILKRSEAYIGVLIDDLVTKGVEEPYRMMTSRAEYRLFLRQDNADLRLSQKGFELGLTDNERYKRYKEKLQGLEDIKRRLNKSYSPAQVAAVFAAKAEPLPAGGIKGAEILKRSTLTKDDLIAVDPAYKAVDYALLTLAETEIKYEGYLKKQDAAIREAHKLEEKALSPNIDYMQIDGLRNEAKQRLNKVKPLSLAQASRISGVNPADISVLMIWLAKAKK